MRFLTFSLVLFSLPVSGAPKSEDPIVAPENAASVPLPDSLQKAANRLGLNLAKVPAFHDERNILELSFYGNRRGVPGPNKTSILIEKGLQRYWLANDFPDPKPTTIIGPFKGNAVEDLKLLALLEEGLKKRNYSSHMQALRGLLHSKDPDLIRLGLQIIPPAMAERPRDVQTFLHFLEGALPANTEAYAEMGLAKETTAALQSMEEAGERIKVVTVQPPARDYQPGYDPTKEQRNGIGVLPEDAWGEAKHGLQAAITTPPTLKLNEKHQVYFVFRNITEDTIRVSFPEVTGNLRLRYHTTPGFTYGGTTGIGGVRQALTHWALAPAHQAMVICRDLQIMKKGAFTPKNAYDNGKSDTISLWSSCGSGDEWEYRSDKEPRLVAVPESEWKGYLKSGIRTVELLADEVPYVPVAPRELGLNHGLEPTPSFPKGMDSNRSEAVEIRSGVLLYLNHENDSHWIVDHDTHNQTVSWGPMTALRLHELGLLNLVEQNTRKLLDQPAPQWDAYRRLVALVKGAPPLANLGLSLAPNIDVDGAHQIRPDHLTRTIRDRRVELGELGLEQQMQTALTALTKFDAPLPPEDQFILINNQELPPELADEAWGPGNDGLRAAALMPKTIKDGTTAPVRLFIRNVSDRDIFLTVSNRAGYDYATSIGAEGNELPARRPHVYPTFFSSFITPELNPGQSVQNPPLATLTKLLLQPGAIYELETRTALTFQTKVPDPVASETIQLGQQGPDQEPAATVVTTAPTEAMVTWHLHTANGAAHSEDLKSRTWPAKGGWTGLLETAPLKVSLRAAAEE